MRRYIPLCLCLWLKDYRFLCHVLGREKHLEWCKSDFVAYCCRPCLSSSWSPDGDVGETSLPSSVLALDSFDLGKKSASLFPIHPSPRVGVVKNCWVCLWVRGIAPLLAWHVLPLQELQLKRPCTFKDLVYVDQYRHSDHVWKKYRYGCNLGLCIPSSSTTLYLNKHYNSASIFLPLLTIGNLNWGKNN